MRRRLRLRRHDDTNQRRPSTSSPCTTATRRCSCRTRGTRARHGMLASLGFEALATTSSGFAATLGRLDGSVTRDEAIAHGAAPRRRDRRADQRRPRERLRRRPRRRRRDRSRSRSQAGLAGCSIEDYSGSALYPLDLGDRTRRGRGRGRARRRRSLRAHRARREPHPRQSRSRRHDRAAAGVSGSRRRRAVRARAREPRRHPPRSSPPSTDRSTCSRSRTRPASPSWPTSA